MPEASDTASYDRPVARIRRFIIVLGAAGTIAVTIIYGWQTGLGFLVAATASYMGFWRQRRVVDSLAPDRSRKRFPIARFILHFAIVGLAGFAIVKYLEVNRLAAVSGLLVAAAAVVLEILYELIYGAASS